MAQTKSYLLVPSLHPEISLDKLEEILSPDEIALMVLIDGRTSLEGLALLSGKPVGTLFAILTKMHTKGVLLLDIGNANSRLQEPEPSKTESKSTWQRFSVKIPSFAGPQKKNEMQDTNTQDSSTRKTGWTRFSLPKRLLPGETMRRRRKALCRITPMKATAVEETLSEPDSLSEAHLQRSRKRVFSVPFALKAAQQPKEEPCRRAYRALPTQDMLNRAPDLRPPKTVLAKDTNELKAIPSKNAIVLPDRYGYHYEPETLGHSSCELPAVDSDSGTFASGG